MLGNIIKKQAQPQVVRVSNMLTEALGQTLGREAGEPVQVGEKFRMSGIHKLCPRMYALALRDGVTLSDEVKPDLMWTFGVGTAYHTQFQEDWLRSLGKVFQGWWRCKKCNHVHKGEAMEGSLSHKWRPCPDSCETFWDDEGPCDGKDFEYVELEFEWPEYRLTGHCDGVLDWSAAEGDLKQDRVEVLELKTINARGFDYVNPAEGGKPKADHVAQAHGYLWGTGLEDVRIVYIKKSDEAMGKVVCEHEVRRDESIIDDMKSMLVSTMDALKDVSEGKDAPVRLPICKKKSDKRAKYCPMKAACFAKC